jgi:hypothetical protein
MLWGCLPRQPRGAAKKSAPAQIQQEPGLPRSVETAHPRIRWQLIQPGGGLWRQLDVQAERGTADASAQSGVLQDTHGTLYSRNVPRALFRAPVVEARKDNQTLVAPRGARITSISPVGIEIVANRVTWRADLDRVVAEGNVRFEQRDPRTHHLIAWGGPFDRVTFKTDLERLTIP